MPEGGGHQTVTLPESLEHRFEKEAAAYREACLSTHLPELKCQVREHGRESLPTRCSGRVLHQHGARVYLVERVEGAHTHATLAGPTATCRSRSTAYTADALGEDWVMGARFVEQGRGAAPYRGHWPIYVE